MYKRQGHGGPEDPQGIPWAASTAWKTKCAKAHGLSLIHIWNIRGIEIGDALLRENKEEIKDLLEKNHMQVSCSNAFYDFGHNPDAAQGKKQIDLAEEFGVSKVLIIPGELSENEASALNALSASKEQTDSYMSENASIQNMVQALKELVAYGKEKNILVTVSYTHLDVYKRQAHDVLSLVTFA